MRHSRSRLVQAVAIRALSFAVMLTAAFPASAQENDQTDIAMAVTYVTDVLTNVDGGESAGTGWMGRADLTISLEGRAIGLDGVSFYFDLMGVHGTHFSETFVNDGQVVSNVEAPSTLRPIEAWARVELPAGAALKIGVIDLNSEFDVQEVGGHFINSSHGIGPDFSQSGLNGPSIFPNTSVGAVLSHSGEGFAARVGIFDAMPGGVNNPGRFIVRLPSRRGALLVGEADVEVAGRAKLRLGGWHYTTRFDHLTSGPASRGASSGIYAMAEGKIVAGAGQSSLDGWLRIGTARDEVNPIGVYIGSGLTYGNGDRRIGIAVAHARLGAPAREAAWLSGITPYKSETAIELTYSGPVRNGVRWQPNVQYIIHPGWDRQRPNALVVGVRLSLDFELK